MKLIYVINHHSNEDYMNNLAIVEVGPDDASESGMTIGTKIERYRNLLKVKYPFHHSIVFMGHFQGGIHVMPFQDLEI